MKTTLRIFTVAALLTLAACGNKGPLVHPTPAGELPAPATTAPATPTDDGTTPPADTTTPPPANGGG